MNKLKQPLEINRDIKDNHTVESTYVVDGRLVKVKSIFHEQTKYCDTVKRIILNSVGTMT